jgi:archaellum component FlaC
MLTTEQKYKIALAELNFFKNMFKNEQAKYQDLAKEFQELKKQYEELEDEYRAPIPDWIPVYEDGKIINL